MNHQMKFTQYFLATQVRDDRKNIKLEWIELFFIIQQLK
jgi:hypothetical protein